MAIAGQQLYTPMALLTLNPFSLKAKALKKKLEVLYG